MPRDTYDHPGLEARLPDGRTLNFVCSGAGAPTVILESGFGVGAYAWGRTQPRIAAETRVCAYDRAGYGFSDPGPLPRDGAHIARDLDRGLAAAGIKGPFVLVGHSAGGLYARLFAARRRRDVVGIVFVDPSVSHQERRFDDLFGPNAGSLGGIRRRPAHCLEVLTAKDQAGGEAERAACANQGRPGRDGAGLTTAYWESQLSELDTLFDATSDEVDRTRRVLKDIPAIVLTAAQADGPSAPPDAGAAAWRTFHDELAGEFLHADHRLVKSGHLMMNERPEVVAGAALELVEAARRGGAR
jgi:pimeloyl-ACP methyl ester carboxylesterase